jgi:hypothetical protein
MKVRGHGLNIGGRGYAKGEVIPWRFAYEGLMLHMFFFGVAVIFLAYLDPSPSTFFLYMWGAFGATLYIGIYSAMFGADEVKWLFINSGLGILGIATQMDWLLSLIGLGLADFPVYIHVVPFIYYVLYTFLLRQALLDLFRAYERPALQRTVNGGYVVFSIAVYVGSWWLRQ